jgi:hypothetical protein
MIKMVGKEIKINGEECLWNRKIIKKFWGELPTFL